MTAPQKYHIFGQGISQSLSPVIHNAGFSHCGLPHHYDIQECTSLDDVNSLIDNPAFGGSSITMPHKLSAHKFCTNISDSAVTIGAINTLVAREGEIKAGIRTREIHGDNTDWSGLYSLVSEYTTTHHDAKQDSVGLVIGAGGAARAGVYAMIQAGIQRIYIANRTLEKAVEVAGDFEGLQRVIPVAFPSRLAEPVDVVIGTIPGEAMTAEAFIDLFQKKQGLCIEMSYKPRVTNLLAVARQHSGWITADGLEVLLRQAFEQFRMWSGMEPPEAVMRKAVADAIEKERTSVNAHI